MPHQNPQSPLIEQFTKALLAVKKRSSRNFALLCQLLGLKKAPVPTQALTHKFAISRERIRQIEARFWRRCSKDPLFQESMERFEALLAKESGIAPLQSLTALGSDYGDVCRYEAIFRRALIYLPWPGGRCYSTHSFSGQLWVVALSPRGFSKFRRFVLEELRRGNTAAPDIDRIHLMAQVFLKGSTSRDFIQKYLITLPVPN